LALPDGDRDELVCLTRSSSGRRGGRSGSEAGHPWLLLGKDLGGWRGLAPTTIAGAIVTVGCGLVPLLLLPRWLGF